MLKKWIAEGIVAILAITSTPTLEGANLPSKAGETIVFEVQSRYENGEYDRFLKELHTEYEKAGAAGALRGIFESAKTAISTREDETSLQDYRAKMEELNKERNQRLLDAIAENPDLEIVQKVDSVVFFHLPVEQKAVLSELESLKFHIPETAEGTIENKISAIETEFYIKSLLLDISRIKSGNTSEELEKKKIALSFAKLDKMHTAAKEEGNKHWMKKIELAKAGFYADKAFKINLDSLAELANQKVVPQNTVEEKVKQIMMDYQSQQRSNIEELVAQK